MGGRINIRLILHYPCFDSWVPSLYRFAKVSSYFGTVENMVDGLFLGRIFHLGLLQHGLHHQSLGPFVKISPDDYIIGFLFRIYMICDGFMFGSFPGSG